MKIFFAFAAFFLFELPLMAQTNDHVAWFESTFRTGTKAPTEKAIEKKLNEVLIASENNDPELQVKLLMEVGAVHLYDLKSREKALGFLIEALAIEDSLKFDQQKVFTLLGIGRVFEEVTDFGKSIEYDNQAQQLNDQLNNPALLLLILKEQGRIRTKRGDNDLAIEKYQQVFDYAEAHQLKSDQGDALYNLGRLYMFEKDYDKALELHKKALAIQRSLKNRKVEAQTLNSFADLYLLLKNPERAMANHQATLEIRKELNDKAGMAFTYNRIGEINFRNKEYSRAIANLQLGLRYAMETQQQEEIRRSYNFLSQVYKEQNDFKKALEYRELFIAIDDFIKTENSSVQLSDAGNRYALLQKEKEVSKLETKRINNEKVIEDQAKLQTLLFAIIALGFIIVALVTYLFFVKQKLAKSLRDINAAKDQLFSIIGHDIKGPLNSLMSFASLLKDHGDMITKEEIKMLSTDLDKSLKNLLTLLENLLQWARTQSGNMDFKKEEIDISQLLHDNKQLLEGQAANKNITLKTEFVDSLKANVNLNSINTVVRNLLSNAIKFTPNHGTITIKAEDGGDELLISIIDSGVGIDPASLEKLFKVGTKHSTLGTANEKGTGLGLILCKEFVEKNGGQIGVSSTVGQGSTFYFTIPVESNA